MPINTHFNTQTTPFIFSTIFADEARKLHTVLVEFRTPLSPQRILATNHGDTDNAPKSGTARSLHFVQNTEFEQADGAIDSKFCGIISLEGPIHAQLTPHSSLDAGIDVTTCGTLKSQHLYYPFERRHFMSSIYWAFTYLRHFQVLLTSSMAPSLFRTARNDPLNIKWSN